MVRVYARPLWTDNGPTVVRQLRADKLANDHCSLHRIVLISGPYKS